MDTFPSSVSKLKAEVFPACRVTGARSRGYRAQLGSWWMVSQTANPLRGTRPRIHVCIPSVSVHFVFESCLSRVVHSQLGSQLQADVFPACRSTACRSTGATSYKPSKLTSPILSRVLGFAGTSRGTPAWRRVDGVTDVLLMPVIPSVCVSKLSVQAQSGSLSSMQGHGSEVAGIVSKLKAEVFPACRVTGARSRG